VTWLGHSTFLLHLGGRAYLTDPILSTHCSPIPLRQFQSSIIHPLAVEDLPPIDGVLLSHNHFDHMDRPTLTRIASRPTVFCPTGVGAYLRKWGVSRFKELSWGDSTEDHEVRITAVPAQHGSARSAWDRNRSLWCGWLLEYGERRLLFLGDTGYAPFFREFADYFGPIDLALIPIGAYRPAWFMQPLHLDPLEAVIVHRELRARHSIAMHWGTFRLSDEPLEEPPHLLHGHLDQWKISSDEFRIPRLNETVVI
jgi:N-acyl-phosphatidylethanolamine-hydrolysing phospholipase D